MKNILTIFSGRQQNLEILIKYLQKALKLGIIDEVHFWNNTRNSSDELYLREISNLKRTSSADAGRYIKIFTPIENNQISLNVKASNDIHIKLNEYEIVLGGWSNTKSVIRKNNIELYSLMKKNIADPNNYINIFISINGNNLEIYKNGHILINYKLEDKILIKDIYVKTGHKSVGDFIYKISKNNGFYFMDTCEKSWRNYYSYYNDSIYIEDIILKCDDDIVFIDLEKLPNFINFIKYNDYDLVFANTINNGVSAFFQQNKYNLIPKTLMELEYPTGGLCGTLWENGKKAEKLHNYFLENYLTFLNYNYKKEIIPINTRFSINFFGYKGKNWNKIVDCYKDDEYNLTVEYVNLKNFKNVLYSDFYVSHLSFYKQVETNINSADLLIKYKKLAEKILTETHDLKKYISKKDNYKTPKNHQSKKYKKTNSRFY